MNLFVYGTLAPGEPNEHILKPIGGTWQKASVRGHLFAEGWGAALGYPGIVLNPDAQEVQGLIFTSAKLGEFWDTLDEFEGEGYKRVSTSVLIENGEQVEAFIYELSDAGPKQNVDE